MALHWSKHECVRANMNVRNIYFTASAIKGGFGRIHPLVFSQQLPVQQLRGARPPSHLTVLKWAAKRWLRKRLRAKQQRKRAEASLEKNVQAEKELKQKYKEARAAWKAKGGVSDPDLPNSMNSDSSEESCG